MTANVLPFVRLTNNEPIISSDYWGSETFRLSDMLIILDQNNNK